MGWLAKSSQPARAEKKKEELVSSSSRLASTVCEEMASSVQGSFKEKLRQDLLKAWSGGEKVEPRKVAEPSIAVAATMSSRVVADFAPVSLEKIHPMGRMRAEMQAAAQRTWLATATTTATANATATARQ